MAKRAKTPKDIETDLATIKAERKAKDAELDAKVKEAQRLIDREVFDVLKALKKQASSNIEITETTNEVSFKMSFSRASITGSPDANKALAAIRAFSKAAGLDIVKGEK